MTYTQAAEFLSKGRIKTSRKIGNIRSTQFAKRDNGIALRYHETDVATLHPDGSATLNSGGYRTATTKERINSYTPARVYQRLGLWYMRDGSLFYDGITVRPDGTPRRPMKPAKTEAKKRELDRLVFAYVRAAKEQIARDGMPTPGGGDCWLCLMQTKDGKCLGEATGNVDHILSHLREKYVHGSILWNAVQRRGNPAFCYGMGWSVVGRDLAYYLRTLKPALLALM